MPASVRSAVAAAHCGLETMITFARSLHTQAGSKLVKHAVGGVVALFCLISIPFLIRQISNLRLLGDVGYGDSYVLHDVLRFQETGLIYHDLSQEPYLPAQYSPMMYMLFSLPGRIISAETPFIGPRLVVLASFLLCVTIVTSIVRTLIPARFTWIWGALLACTISSMWEWILQIRADFSGICFSLLAIRLLLSRSRWAVFLAGVSAGLAVQFKFTLVAALATGALWLLVQRRWKDLARFAVLGTISSAGLYVLYSVREPSMLSQMLALTPGVLDVRGGLRLMHQAVNEPVVLLSLLGLPRVRFSLWPRWVLILAFAATSFAVAGLTDLQAGGNINYFFEGLFALIPLAALGVLRMMALARQRMTVGLFVAALFAVHYLAPRAQELRYRLENPDTTVESRNQVFRAIERVLSGRRILSTVPGLALIDPRPPLTEPYLLSYLQRLGKFDPQPILERIRQKEFDVVITSVHPGGWRGIDHVSPDLRNAIAASYRPQCILRGTLVHLPRNPGPVSSALAQDLANIGCVPTPPE
jgi:hypothetical protein